MWVEWPFTRVVILFTAFGFFLIFIQVTLMHYRQNFHHWSQWMPVIALPILALNALILSFLNHTIIRNLFTILTVAGMLEGLFGFFKHLTGIGKRVDGYRFHNFLVGPPIILPLMITAFCLLGFLALYWS